MSLKYKVAGNRMNRSTWSGRLLQTGPGCFRVTHAEQKNSPNQEHARRCHFVYICEPSIDQKHSQIYEHIYMLLLGMAGKRAKYPTHCTTDKQAARNSIRSKTHIKKYEFHLGSDDAEVQAKNIFLIDLL